MLVRALNFAGSFDRLTHYAFRYPAKFHPPVARYLIDNFSKRGQHVIDPFCGSGTLLVEGVKAGRKMHGVDLDPVAAFISRIKSTPLHDARVFKELNRFAGKIESTKKLRKGEWVPCIPNIEHWFERHVLRDMASLHQALAESRSLSLVAREIAKCAFLSSIRNWSNADPVPVSGLEVTKHIKLKRAKGFFPDVRKQYATSLRRITLSIQQFTESLEGDAYDPIVIRGDAYEFFRTTRRRFAALVTSPPYLTAVDYYRRHTLEMYWMDSRMTPESRRALRRQYIGQSSVNAEMATLTAEIKISEQTKKLATQINKIDPRKARAFLHYFQTMKQTFQAAANCLSAKAPLVVVIGDGYLAGKRIPTSDLLAEEFAEFAQLVGVSEYLLKNRYMTYARHNDADIGLERILVFRTLSDG